MLNQQLTGATRIDFSSQGQLVFAKCWYGTWQPETPPAHEEPIDGVEFLDFAKSLEAAGFVVWCVEGVTRYRALRGKITRIDFWQTANGWQVKKYPHGWRVSTPPVKAEKYPADWDVSTALAWCSQNGYTVHSWPKSQLALAGSRAWLGAPEPVHDRRTIQERRVKIKNLSSMGYDMSGVTGMDLAFDL